MAKIKADTMNSTDDRAINYDQYPLDETPIAKSFPWLYDEPKMRADAQPKIYDDPTDENYLIVRMPADYSNTPYGFLKDGQTNINKSLWPSGKYRILKAIYNGYLKRS